MSFDSHRSDDAEGDAEDDALVGGRQNGNGAGSRHKGAALASAAVLETSLSSPPSPPQSFTCCRRLLLIPFLLAVGAAAFFVISLTDDERWLRGGTILPYAGVVSRGGDDVSLGGTGGEPNLHHTPTTVVPPEPEPHFTAPASCTILVVSDANHRSKNILQAATLRSYATLHGYAFEVADPSEVAPECDAIEDFFFKKHCAVSYWMERTQAEGSATLVLDGDVVAVGGDSLSLDRWLHGGFSDNVARSFDIVSPHPPHLSISFYSDSSYPPPHPVRATDAVREVLELRDRGWKLLGPQHSLCSCFSAPLGVDG